MPISRYRARQMAGVAAWIGAVLAFIGVVSGVRASRIEVRNQSGATVTDLVLRYQGGELRVGQLAPEQRLSLRACPARPSVALASWKVDGEEHTGPAGYLSCGVFCLEIDLRRGGGASGQSTSCE